MIDLEDDCSFTAASEYAVHIGGNITERHNNGFSGTAQTDYRGCGQLSISCTDSGAEYSCNYQYLSGGGKGYITNMMNTESYCFISPPRHY
ncbi:MAG: hypothetical protein KJ990_14430 [Proteobacteria bacterium]|nr:hypothetical protein [Pseudomonadota bacterium]MBU1650543.1 hypothetical protein [Pseudomonadota bacterium]